MWTINSFPSLRLFVTCTYHSRSHAKPERPLSASLGDAPAFRAVKVQMECFSGISPMVAPRAVEECGRDVNGEHRPGDSEVERSGWNGHSDESTHQHPLGAAFDPTIAF
jgi:hypothetical protein